MRAFILMACLAYAAAEAGYSYSRPGHSGGSADLGGSIGHGSLGGSGGFGSLGGLGDSGFGSSGSGQGLGGGFGGSGSGGFGGSGSGGFGGSGSGGFGGSGAGFGGQAIVQKHIYVHVPPQEQEVRHQQHIAVPQAQKHYKIIFIKAPSAPAYQAPIIPVQPQNEEKTLVYVLVKKPEAQQDIIIPTAAPTQPSKPEVYFIKYNTQKEVVNGGGAGGLGGGLGASIGGGQGLGGFGGSADLGLGSSGLGSGSGLGLGSGILSGSGSGISSGHGSSGSAHLSSEYGVPH